MKKREKINRATKNVAKNETIKVVLMRMVAPQKCWREVGVMMDRKRTNRRGRLLLLALGTGALVIIVITRFVGIDVLVVGCIR